MPLPFHRRRLDPDAADFCRRSGATDRAAINAFVRGVKDLGLWDNMVCWPLRSAQNAGVGDTVYSLGGLGAYDGTLVNGPTWTADGINCPAFEELSLGSATSLLSYGPFSYFSVQKYNTLNPKMTVLRTRQDANWPNATTTQVDTNGASHRLNVSNTRRVLADVSATLALWHSQMTATAGDETGFVTYNKDAPVAFGAATSGAVAPTGQWRLSGDANGTYAFQLIAHQNAHGLRAALYDLYKSTLGTGLSLP